MALLLANKGVDNVDEGAEEEQHDRSPCEAEGVGSDLCCSALVAELIAGFDEDGTANCYLQKSGERISEMEEDTYVIKQAANVKKKLAASVKSPVATVTIFRQANRPVRTAKLAKMKAIK